MKFFVRFLCIALVFSCKAVLALGSTCLSGELSGYVNYNVPYHLVIYSSFDLVYGNSIFWETTIKGPAGGGSNTTHYLEYGYMSSNGGRVGSFVVNPKDGAYDISGIARVGYPAPSPTYVTSNNSSTCSGTAKLVSNPPTMSFLVPTALTLNDDYTFPMSVRHPFATPTNYKIEIKRTSSSSYDTLYSGPSPSYSSYAKVAGNFNLRGSVTVNGSTYTAAIKTLAVNFLSFSQIVADPQNIIEANNMWNLMISLLTPTTRQEVGAWVKFNTATRSYEYSSVVYGLPTSNSGSPPPTASIDLLSTKPSDTPALPLVLSSPTYVVASFHTHTAGTYFAPGYCVAPVPSPADISVNTIADVTGVVYVWDAPHCNGGSLSAPHSLKQAGPFRRATPP
ncbi:MAG: hypothetical protein LBF16_01515 [Pseudomonadales bacterium]|jgi:hypothetical protein|nr:hypothetical protein [Pseudomonadales bacterium]